MVSVTVLNNWRFRAFYLGLIVVAALAPVPGPALAQAPAESALPEEGAETPTAPVTLDGKELFRVSGVSARPADVRARVISGRLTQLASDPMFSPEKLNVVDQDGLARIIARDQIVMVIRDADAQAEGLTRQQLAQLLKVRMSEAIYAYRQERSPEVLVRRVLVALAATVVLLLAIWLVSRLFWRLHAFTEKVYASRVQKLRIQSFEVIQAERLRASLQVAQRTARVIVVLAVVFFYLEFVLGMFPWSRPASQRLFGVIIQPLQSMGMAFVGWLPSLVFLVILVIVVRYLLKLGRLFFEAIERGGVTFSGFDREWALPTFRIVRVLVVAFALVVAYPYLPGSDSAAFKGVSLFLGLVFSFGSSSVVANLVAGYAITYRRAFKVGDRVKIGDAHGIVAETRLSVTHVRSIKNEEIIVPNMQIMNTSVINYSSLSRSSGLILYTAVCVGYNVPWRQVESMLLMAVERTPGLLREPPPFVLQPSLGAFGVNYELNAYTDKPLAAELIYSALHRNILDIFNEYGVQLMTPAYEGDPKEPKLVPKEKWFVAPAAGE